MNDHFLRQQDVLDAARLNHLGITLIGLGSIGSMTGLALSKMGVVGITAFDADCVEVHNWANQMYCDEDIGRLKAHAFADLVAIYGGHAPNAIATRYVDQPLTELVISAVDSMESRTVIWKSAREKPDVKLLIDARMGLETLVVWTVRPQVREDRVAYSQSLVPDDQALQEPCTARTICYTPLMAASIVCNLVKRFVNDEDMPRRIVLDLATFTLMAEPR